MIILNSKALSKDSGMSKKELKEINQYWNKKYPHIQITLWENAQNNKYFGQMITASSSMNLEANTIGDLINQGESFLRKYL